MYGEYFGNPGGVGEKLQEWTKGIGPVEAACALGGLAASMMIPGYLVKTETTAGKLGRIGLGLGCAIVAGMAADSISPTAGQVAVAGGIAGTLAHALAAFTSVQIGTGPKLLGPGVRRIAPRTAPSAPAALGSRFPAHPYADEFADVRLS